MKVKNLVAVFAFAFIGWALCAAVMGIGMGLTSLQNALIVHAIAAPVIFAVLSLAYFTWFRYATPLQTALLFMGFVIFMDTFVVALLVQRSFEMFSSILGTWIPFMLIFTSTYVTGICVTGADRPQKPDG